MAEPAGKIPKINHLLPQEHGASPQPAPGTANVRLHQYVQPFLESFIEGHFNKVHLHSCTSAPSSSTAHNVWRASGYQWVWRVMRLERSRRLQTERCNQLRWKQMMGGGLQRGTLPASWVPSSQTLEPRAIETPGGSMTLLMAVSAQWERRPSDLRLV